MLPSPSRVVWTEHAVVKATILAIARADVERWVLAGHAGRGRNAGAADWRITAGRVVIVYNHPDDGDEVAARVVTLWRRR